MNKTRGKGKLIDRKFILNVLLVSGMIVVFFLFCGFAGITRILSEERFASGVLISGVNVSGMSHDEAETSVTAHMQQQLDSRHITLDYLGNTQELGSDSLGISYDIADALNEAYQYNKMNTDTVEQRFNKTAYLYRGIDFQPEMLIDQIRLRDSLEQYAAQYYQSPVNAAAVFDADTETFSYTQ
jgi:hypothetical protein